MKKLMMLIAGLAMTVGLMAGNVSVTAVTAQQRYPWNGLVDITVTFSGASDDVAKTACEFVASNNLTQTALPFVSVHPVGIATGSGNAWTRCYVWDARADVGEVKIDDVVLAVRPTIGGVQLWKDGPYWAECNVGAQQPEENGSFFSWGGTAAYEYENDTWRAVDGSTSGFSFADAQCPTFGKSVAVLEANGVIDTIGNLTATSDAAAVCLGSPWRMPTAAEFDALLENCTSEWTERFGVCGRLLKGKGDYASRSVFFPATGFGADSSLEEIGGLGRYWSATPESGMVEGGRILLLTPYLATRVSVSRYFGQNVRAVRGAASDTVGADVASVATHLGLDCRTGIRIADAKEGIRFSPAWETSANGAVATVKLDGAAVANQTASGTFAWTPTKAGLYRFTHTVAVAGEPVGVTESATFAVGVSDVASLYEPAANGERVIDCLVAGVDPAGARPDDPQAKFLALIDADDEAVSISWTPDLNEGGATARIYNILGCDDLETQQWEDVRPWHHFFKVVATMPTGNEDTAVSGASFAPQAKPQLDGVQLWKDGPFWAEWNVGARVPEEFGNLFWWGDTVGYTAEGGILATLGGSRGFYSSDVTWVSSTGVRSEEGPFWGRKCPTHAQPVSALQALGYVDSLGNLAAAHDAATACCGAPWRMPTADDFAGLVANCDWERTAQDGVNGVLVKGRGAYAAKSVFFPASGYGHESTYCNANAFGRYWTSTAGAGFDAVQYIFNDGGFTRNDNWQNQGAAVRPVRDAAK